MAKVTLVFAILRSPRPGRLFHHGKPAPDRSDPHLVGAGSGYWRIPCDESQRAPAQALHAHQCYRRRAGLSGGGGCGIDGYGTARSAGIESDHEAMGYKLAMADLLLIYVNLCVRSFIDARRAREQ